MGQCGYALLKNPRSKVSEVQLLGVPPKLYIKRGE
jgi:hypothetical protein